MDVGIQSGPQLVVSGVSEVAAEGEEASDFAWEAGVSSSAVCTGGGKQAAPLQGPDTVAVSLHDEPPMLTAAATAVSVVREGSVPHVCVASLTAKAGVDGKEAEDRG